MPEAFFEPDDGWFSPTELTRGPWSPDHQHAGPPAALIGRALERCEPCEAARFGRVTVEILRPIPLAPLRVQTRVARPGRSVALLEATLSDERGEVARASAWRIRTTTLDLPAPMPAGAPPAGPESARPGTFFDTGEQVGYHTAMEYRFVAGDFIEPGPATVWMRMRHPLVQDEQPSPLQRVLIAADSGNGVSAVLDWNRFVFVNTDLTVNLHRYPSGEWVRLDAVTVPEPDGVGLADTTLHDEHGALGRALQTLLIGERT